MNEPTYNKTISFGDSEVVEEKGRALHVCIPVNGKKWFLWIPASQIHHTSQVINKKSGKGTLVIPEWLAKKRRIV